MIKDVRPLDQGRRLVGTFCVVPTRLFYFIFIFL